MIITTRCICSPVIGEEYIILHRKSVLQQEYFIQQNTSKIVIIFEKPLKQILDYIP